jgi:hypothetical protein
VQHNVVQDYAPRWRRLGGETRRRMAARAPVAALAFDVHSRVNRWPLHHRAAKVAQLALHAIGVEVSGQRRSRDDPLGVVGVGASAQEDLGVVALAHRDLVAGQARRAPKINWQHTGCQRIQGSAVTYVALTAAPSQPRHCRGGCDSTRLVEIKYPEQL